MRIAWLDVRVCMCVFVCVHAAFVFRLPVRARVRGRVCAWARVRGVHTRTVTGWSRTHQTLHSLALCGRRSVAVLLYCCAGSGTAVLRYSGTAVLLYCCTASSTAVLLYCCAASGTVLLLYRSTANSTE